MHKSSLFSLRWSHLFKYHSFTFTLISSFHFFPTFTFPTWYALNWIRILPLRYNECNNEKDGWPKDKMGGVVIKKKNEISTKEPKPTKCQRNRPGGDIVHCTLHFSHESLSRNYHGESAIKWEKRRRSFAFLQHNFLKLNLMTSDTFYCNTFMSTQSLPTSYLQKMLHYAFVDGRVLS